MFSDSIKAKINAAYNSRFAALPLPNGLDEILNNAKDDEALCLKYLYAFMPLSDLISYDADIYAKIVRHALMVRELNLWNEEVPEDIWFNFVLQYRVNNENVEFNRSIIYNQLYPMVVGKNINNAVIEAGYWGIARMTYSPTNPRTLAPLGVFKSTYGRCGEGSVLIASALRAIGIPARQVHVPRWAHCDGNHAWVESYIGGKWIVSEAEPAVGKSWVNLPASRANIVLSRVFSRIECGEEIAYSTDISHEINLTPLYCQNTVKVIINVKNAEKPLQINVQNINGSSIATLLTIHTDESGTASVTLGRGDVFLHITDGERFVIHHISANEHGSDKYVLELDCNDFVTSKEGKESVLFSPTKSDYKDPDFGVTDEMRVVYETRMKAGNAEREAYFATFANDERAKEIAVKYGMSEDDARIFTDARGNLSEILKFLDDKSVESVLSVANKIRLLKILQPKDLIDVSADVLLDLTQHAYPPTNDIPTELYDGFVLNPRIGTEMLTAYRGMVLSYFNNEAEKEEFRKDPRALWQVLNNNIASNNRFGTASYSVRGMAASPAKLLEYKVGDDISKQTLFVAIARTIGIPVRSTISSWGGGGGSVEFWAGGKFAKLPNHETNASSASQTSLHTSLHEKKIYNLTINGIGLAPFTNFSAARLVNGEYTHTWLGATPNFGVGMGAGRGGGGRRRYDIAGTHTVEAGNYRFIAALRLADGTVSANIYYVTVDDDKTVNISLPVDTSANVCEPKDVAGCFTGNDLAGFLREYTLIAHINPGSEPTEQLLGELAAAISQIKEKNLDIIFATNTTNESLETAKETAKQEGINLMISDDTSACERIAETCGLNGGNLPILALVKDGKNAVYYTHGLQRGSITQVLSNL
ncbi:MAG: transglutaminase-like domain-containing protein [Defluviitaleaceae bacterium]|nr:transglutaminase-like domain-containing protein [Defluviitaleaceae bacterium]